MQYTTYLNGIITQNLLYYQDFKDTFVCNTQRSTSCTLPRARCIIRISKILLYAIHNIHSGTVVTVTRSGTVVEVIHSGTVVEVIHSGTVAIITHSGTTSKTTRSGTVVTITHSGTTAITIHSGTTSNTTRSGTVVTITLYYQDFKDTFVCNTQLIPYCRRLCMCCIIRISKILLYAIHNPRRVSSATPIVVLSGFQRYFCMQYTTYR